MSVNVQVIFYSTYGHVWRLAEAVAEGARAVSGAQVQLLRVPETLSAEVLAKMGAAEAQKAFAHIPIADPKNLADADAIILGSPTRYGAATAQMRAFQDATGGLWASGALIGKVGSAFTSTASQHGGQETTLLAMSTFFFHMGMVIVGVPYSNQELLNLSEITGGSPYGRARSPARGASDSRPPTNWPSPGPRADMRPRSRRSWPRNSTPELLVIPAGGRGKLSPLTPGRFACRRPNSTHSRARSAARSPGGSCP
jgi:NAD(P)H:quinone oxidoreductase type IV